MVTGVVPVFVNVTFLVAKDPKYSVPKSIPYGATVAFNGGRSVSRSAVRDLWEFPHGGGFLAQDSFQIGD